MEHHLEDSEINRVLVGNAHPTRVTPSAIKGWQPVIQRWQHILELELEQQKTAFQGELLNPFTYGNPLRRNQADVFKGRQSFADEIIRLVLDRNRPTLALHGPRRCGKSSFLLNLPRLLPSDIIPVYLDLQNSGVNNSDSDFCYSLARAIHRDSRGQGVKLPALPEVFTNGEPYFTNVWTEFTGTTPQEIQVGQALLLKIAKGQLKRIPDHPLVQSALRRLTRFHVLEQTDSGYQFEILMVREWVAERAIVTNPSTEA